MAELQRLIGEEVGEGVDPRITQVAALIAGRFPGARAVVFYGSCLRTGEIEGQMLDFYLIVRSYEAAYGRKWLAHANRLIPPNVFPFSENGLAAKFAVLSEADLVRLTGWQANSVSVWARFAQPVRLVWTADALARSGAIEAIASAVETFLSLAPEGGDVLERWKRGFALTYGAELRAERGDRPASIVDWDPERYRRVGEAAFARSLYSEERWRRLRRNGKLLTLARLAKASLTFAGGVDYLVWKINRHADAGIVLRPWQRRFPILAALTLLPRLLRKGAIR